MARLVNPSKTRTDDSTIASLMAVQRHLEHHEDIRRINVKMPYKTYVDTKDIRKIRCLSLMLAIRQYTFDYSTTEVSVSELLCRINKGRDYVRNYLGLLLFDGAVSRRKGQKLNSIDKHYDCDLYALTARANESLDGLVEKFASKYPEFFVVDTSTTQERKHNDLLATGHKPVGIFDV